MEARLFRIQARKRDCEPQKIIFFSANTCQIICCPIPAGGQEGPMINFLAYMSKQFGGNPILGEEFMTTIVDTQFSKTTLHPMVKLALVVANCTTDKVVDSVAKLITKTDVAGLKQKKYETKINEVEASLTKFWDNVNKTQLDQAVIYKLFGRSCCRYALHLCSKEKQSKDGKEKTMDELEMLQSDDLAQATSAGAAASTSKPSGSGTQDSKEVAFDLQQAKNPMFLAAQLLDLKVGNNFTVKDQPANRIFTLVAVEADKVTLEHVPLLEPTKKITMNFLSTEIAAHLKATKSKMPKLFTNAQLQLMWPSNSDPCMEETEKCSLFVVLQEAYNFLDMDEHEVMVQSTPHAMCFAQKDMKKNYIQLVPCPERLQNIVTKKPPVKIFGEVTFQMKTYYITPSKAVKWDETKQVYEGTMCPFWICSKEDEEGLLEFKWITHSHKLGDVNIKVLTNNSPVSAHCQLSLKAPPKDKDPMGPPLKKHKKQ